MLTEFLVAVGTPLLRNLSGWLENSMKDGKIDKYEWKKFGETAVRLIILQFVTYYGITGMGIDASIFATSASAFIFDVLLVKLEKLRQK